MVIRKLAIACPMFSHQPWLYVICKLQSERCIRNRLVEAQGAEFLSVHFVFRKASFYASREAGFLSQFLKLVC